MQGKAPPTRIPVACPSGRQVANSWKAVVEGLESPGPIHREIADGVWQRRIAITGWSAGSSVRGHMHDMGGGLLLFLFSGTHTGDSGMGFEIGG